MTDAQKEALALVHNLIRDYENREVVPWSHSHWADRILRFAREYGPKIARQEGMRALEEALPGVFSPVEDTTPPGWTREPRTILAHNTHPPPPERGKPF